MATGNQTKKMHSQIYPVVNMANRLRETQRILSEFTEKDIINRIWHKDFTVWKPEPEEISNRLGWLQVIDTMTERSSDLNQFAIEIKNAGFQHIVLLGMGGSSLGPEVLSQTFGPAAGYPPLIVLDSTHPAVIEKITQQIKPQHSLFLVSSKSGSTIETMSLYRFFHARVEREMGHDQAGRNFVAITDPQTSLGGLARDQNFRKTFLNPPDIGGRFSVLSYFGLLPAVLTGIDINRLLQKANNMQQSCAPCVDIFENPGAWLGALIAGFAIHGRDKLTLIISPSIRSFGLWLEQLLAESTGKEGKGIVPIIDEPLIGPQNYGDDRLFVYLRLKGDDNISTDEFVTGLKLAGQPLIQLEMDDYYDLGAEFFRWEFATAVAGTVMGINPFDQPDVQSTKESSQLLLEDLRKGKQFPRIQSCKSLARWLEQARRDNYLAIMVYLKQTPPVDRAIAKLRKQVLDKYHIATTLGYGPRFLHSTGQLHKGGSNNGLFLQITADRRKDLSIPGEAYSFGILTEAEALGDYHALQARGRRVTRLQLRSASGAAIERLLTDFQT